jgi:hypothetical protein
VKCFSVPARAGGGMTKSLRRALMVGVVGLTLAIIGGSRSYAQSGSCAGNGIIQQAPYSCHASRVINGMTFDVTLDVSSDGRAVISYVMSPAQPVDVAIAAHSYTGIAGDPHQDETGTIPAGQTTAQLVIPRVECGQLDIKAVSTSLGAAAGRIAGPRLSFGQNCRVAAVTGPTPGSPGTTAPTSTAPATAQAPTVSVEARTITAGPAPAQATLPTTGGALDWKWSLPILAGGAVLLVLARRPRKLLRG